jgi:fructoselysine-6-P-deglycase FrlB-like protein
MMIDLDEKLLAVNSKTEILSAYIAPDSMIVSLQKNKDKIKELAKNIHDYNPDELLFAGSGASYCTLYTGYYFMKTNSSLSVKHNFGPVIEFDNEKPLLEKIKQKKVFAIIASYSGKTADTMSISKYLGNLNVPRLALSKSESGPLAVTCDYILPYEDQCLYTSAMANLLMLLSELLKLRGENAASEMLENALKELPNQMKSIMKKSEKFAMEALDKVKDEDMFYVLGDGALWALAYQYGYTNLMEYSRVNAACLRSSEWRHGPLEILFRKPAMIHFIGNDRTREYSLATKKYCEENGAKVITFDVRDYFETLPSLAPFVLHAVSQLFFLYQSTERGIDMDDYLQMHVKPYMPGEVYY